MLTRLLIALALTLVPIAASAQRTTAAANYYVDDAKSDSNDGLTAATAWKTIPHAADYLVGNVDFMGGTATVWIADAASVYAAAEISQPFVGGSSTSPYGAVLFRGTCTVTCAATTNWASKFHAKYGVGYLRLSGVYATAWGIMWLDGGLNWTTATNPCHIYANEGGRVVGDSPYTISGSAYFHECAWYGSSGLELLGSVKGNTVTIVGNPTFSAFAFAYGGGSHISDKNRVFSGAVSGQRWTAQLNATIATNSAGPYYFPGTSYGQVATGGQYQP